MLALYWIMTARWFMRMTRLSRMENLISQSDDRLAAISTFAAGAAKADSLSSAIEAFADHQFNQHALGHFVSEVLLKLGLMGTVLGFILMLMPIAEIKTFEPQALQILLSSMSGGMAVALYTTLTGLITSTLIKFQYYLADSTVLRMTEACLGTES